MMLSYGADLCGEASFPGGLLCFDPPFLAVCIAIRPATVQGVLLCVADRKPTLPQPINEWTNEGAAAGHRGATKAPNQHL